MKKITAVVLAALLIFTSVGAVFAWTSFQNDNALNNGVINDGHTYVTSSVSPVSYTTLSRGGWAGIDCPPLVRVEGTNTYAYVLHTASSGAKLAKVNLASPSSVPTGWPQDGVQVSTSGGFQLSTPIIVGDTIYCAGNVYGNIIQNDEFNDVNSGNVFPEWTVTPGSNITISQSNITLADSTTKSAMRAATSTATTVTVTAEQDGLNIPNAQLNNLRITGAIQFANVGSVTVKVYINGGTSPVKTFGYNSSDPNAIPLVLDNGLYCWNENNFDNNVSSASNGSMKVVIDFTASSAGGYVDLDYAELYEQSSGIGKIENISTTTNPTFTAMISGIVGQINTPISSDGTYIYFGTYTTNGTYYRVKISDNSSLPFEMTGNSTYWAGAAICGDYVVFGTEDGILYSLDKSDMTVKNQKTISVASYIRSSICAVQDGSGYKLYFTSRTGNNGYLWCYGMSSSGSLSYKWHAEIGYTNSTPTVYGDYVYVGCTNGVACYTTSGAKKWITTDPVISSTFTDVRSVQASPVVYRSNGVDYIYVTTNQSGIKGQGFCIAYDHTNNPTLAWQTTIGSGTNGATFCLQGFGAGNGYLVFGNDYSNLFIIH